MNNLNSKKNVNYDAKSDVLYFGIKKGAEEEYSEVAPGVNVELDKAGKVIGVEVLNASKILKPVAKTMQAMA